MKTLLVFLVLTASAIAELRQADISGRLYEDEGTFFGLQGEVPFTFSVQFDTDGFDWNSSPDIGEYYFPTLPLSLSFAGYEFETESTRIIVQTDDIGLNRGFIISSDEPFVGPNGYQVPEYGIYIQFLNSGTATVPNDSLFSVQPSEFEVERMYVINVDWYGGIGPNPSRLLSNSTNGIDSFTVTTVPEISVMTLLAASLVFTGRPKRHL